MNPPKKSVQEYVRENIDAAWALAEKMVPEKELPFTTFFGFKDGRVFDGPPMALDSPIYISALHIASRMLAPQYVIRICEAWAVKADASSTAEMLTNKIAPSQHPNKVEVVTINWRTATESGMELREIAVDENGKRTLKAFSDEFVNSKASKDRYLDGVFLTE